MKTILIMIGTRPECIKLAPLVMALSARPTDFDVRVCLTSQHREMLKQALDWFPIKVDHDLDLMTEGQHQVQLQARILENVKPGRFVRVNDRRIESALRVKAERASVGKRVRCGRRWSPWR